MQEAKRPARAVAIVAAIAIAFILSLGFALPADQAHAASATTATVTIGSKSFKMKLTSGKPAAAFRSYLSKSRAFKMAELNGNEKYRYLNRAFPTAEKRYEKVKAGDVMLYGDNCLVVFYKTHKTSYRYTKIGHLTSTKGLAKAAGKKGVKVRFGKMKQVPDDPVEAPTIPIEAGTPSSPEQPPAPSAEDSLTESGADSGSTPPAEDGQASPDPADQNAAGQEPSEQPEADLATDEPEKKVVRIAVGGQTTTVALADNDAARAFAALVADGPLSVEAHGYGGFEQVGTLPATLPASVARTTTTPGDIVLYQGNQICVFHGSNTWAYTPLGHIEGWTDEQLRQLLGNGDATLVFSLA